MTIKIYTRKGDDGRTGLYGGARVSKDDVRVEAYGAVDELNAALGLARTHPIDSNVDVLLATLQNQLFDLGAQLATQPTKETPTGVDMADVSALERQIDMFESELAPLKSFILPGGTPGAAALHLARCVCRRAERRTVSLRKAEPQTNELCVTYLNRLSDLLFVLARVANARAGVSDVAWQKR